MFVGPLFTVVHTALIRQHTVSSIRELDGEVPATRMTGETGDMSFLCEFGRYKYVWFLTPQHTTESMENKRLGRHCRPSLNHGDAMSAWILTNKGRFVHRTLVFPIKEEEWSSDGFKERVAEFETRLRERLKDRCNPLEPDPEDDEEVETPTHEPYEPIDPNDEPAMSELAEADNIQREAFD